MSIYPYLSVCLYSVEMSLTRLQELVIDREAWHAMVCGILKRWTRLSDWTELDCMYQNISMTWSIFFSSSSPSSFFFLVSFFEELCGRQWLPCPVLLLGNFLDKGTWQVRIYGVTRIGHDWVNETFLVFSILYSYKIFSHLFLELSLWICH